MLWKLEPRVLDKCPMPLQAYRLRPTGLGIQTKKHDEMMMMMMMMMIMMRVDRQVKAHVIMVLCESSVASQVSVET